MDEQTTSPSPGKPVDVTQLLDFWGALKEVLLGNKVTKAEWADKEIYGFMQNDTLKIHINHNDAGWVLSQGDILGEDWVVL